MFFNIYRLKYYKAREQILEGLLGAGKYCIIIL